MSRHSATGKTWQAQRRRVLDRDGWVCTYCGTDLVESATAPNSATVDHIAPIAHNPDHVYADGELVAACRRCNGRRQDAPLRRLDYANRTWLPNGLPQRNDTSQQVRPEQVGPLSSDAGARLVVLLCGPAGAGKTTAARASGLVVYDRDDDQWTSEKQFTAALSRLKSDRHARAVVIRAGATSSARAKAAALIGATHTRLLLADRAELGRRVAHRNRADKQHGLASISDWLTRFDRDDGVLDYAGWDETTGEPR